MRIALVSTPFIRTPPTCYGGIERVVGDLAFILAKMGQDITVIGTNGSYVKGCKVIETGEPQFKSMEWNKEEKNAFKLMKDRLGDFDIIHGHANFCYPYEFRKIKNDARICSTYHGVLAPQVIKYLKTVQPNNFISISKFMSDWYGSQGIQSKTVFNGIDLSRYPFKREKGNRLLFVGRITPYKQPHLAIAVAQMLGLGLDILGGTMIRPDEMTYLQRIQSLCDGEHIVFHANVSDKTKVEFMQNACCLIFPSLMGEPFGLVAVEAMACGTPVVSTNDGAIEEVVKEGGIVGDVYKEYIYPDGGIKVEVNGNPSVTLSDAVFRARKIDPELCRKNAERFSRELMAQNYLKLYKVMMSGETW